MKRLGIYTLFAAGLLLMGCSSENNLEETTIKPPVEETQVPETATPFKALELSSSQKSVGNGVGKFAGDFLRVMAQNKEGNILVSPLGMHIGLSMIANGADAYARQEIFQALGCNDVAMLNSYYDLVVNALAEADNQVKFSSANSLWTNIGCAPQDNYVSLLKQTYKADAFSMAIDSETAKNEINSWCENATNGLIKNFLKSPLAPSTSLALLNALYFNGKWADTFDASLNTFENFRMSSTSRKVEMMHASRKMACAEVENGILLSLPYGNGTFALNIFLPAEGIELEKCVDELQSTGNLSLREVNLTIPKFSLALEYGDLKNELKALGISKIFNSGSSLPLIGENVFLDAVQQNTVLNIDESGAEAAAVTGFYILGADLDTPQNLPVLDININRPFIFSVTAYNDIVIFNGIVNEL